MRRHPQRLLWGLTPSPVTSIPCPPGLNSCHRSTIVVLNPYRVNHHAAAGPAMLPPEMRTDLAGARRDMVLVRANGRKA